MEQQRRNLTTTTDKAAIPEETVYYRTYTPHPVGQ
jgi:hypothetical protein